MLLSPRDLQSPLSPHPLTLPRDHACLRSLSSARGHVHVHLHVPHFTQIYYVFMVYLPISSGRDDLSRSGGIPVIIVIIIPDDSPFRDRSVITGVIRQTGNSVKITVLISIRLVIIAG